MKENSLELVEARHQRGLYSIKELCKMFDCGRAHIDYGVNSGKLKYISPNNRSRYIFLEDFLEYTKKDSAGLATRTLSR